MSGNGTSLSDPEYWRASCYIKGMARASRKIDTDLDQERPGPETIGQAGDTQGLSDDPQADSQSVAELVEEGNFFEAAVIEGIENAAPADVSEVKTRQVPEDDVPQEYLDED